MARVIGPLMSIDASGTVSKLTVFSNWKGRNYVRKRVIPFNPRTDKQLNLRKAFTLTVALWQQLTSQNKMAWTQAAGQYALSGFNLFVSRGIKEYISQIGTNTAPESVTVSGTYPSETWTWS